MGIINYCEMRTIQKYENIFNSLKERINNIEN